MEDLGLDLWFNKTKQNVPEGTTEFSTDDTNSIYTN